MLRIIAEIHISDEREDQIVRKLGLRHSNLIRYIDRRVRKLFSEDDLQAFVKEVHIEPVYSKAVSQKLAPQKGAALPRK
jgi:hypothetical protein